MVPDVEMTADPTTLDKKQLRETLEKNPTDWEARKQLAHLLSACEIGPALA
jgi:hypothetical protein